MTEKKIPMDPREFARKLHEGEKDLVRTTLAKGTDLTETEEYAQALTHLRDQPIEYFTDEPFDLSYSSMRGVIANGLYLPHAKLREINWVCAQLEEAELDGADLEKASLWRANLTQAKLMNASLRDTHLSVSCLFGTDLTGADLTGASMIDTNLSRAHLNNANLEGVNLHGSDFRRADIRNVQNLERARNLGKVRFGTTKAWEAEERICREAMEKAVYFIRGD